MLVSSITFLSFICTKTETLLDDCHSPYVNYSNKVFLTSCIEPIDLYVL